MDTNIACYWMCCLDSMSQLDNVLVSPLHLCTQILQYKICMLIVLFDFGMYQVHMVEDLHYLQYRSSLLGTSLLQMHHHLDTQNQHHMLVLLQSNLLMDIRNQLCRVSMHLHCYHHYLAHSDQVSNMLVQLNLTSNMNQLDKYHQLHHPMVWLCLHFGCRNDLLHTILSQMSNPVSHNSYLIHMVSNQYLQIMSPKDRMYPMDTSIVLLQMYSRDSSCPSDMQ